MQRIIKRLNKYGINKMKTLIDNFSEEKDCEYKGEIYSVRDNGAVMRHLRVGKKARKDDGVWTFGTKDEAIGYMKIGQHRVHIIVATAFYGQKDSKVYVVDHIDTNRCNNRADNLRWLTRLENVLMNPVTLKRVTMLCGGDITKFLENPSCLRDLTGTNQDLTWMRTVSPEEAVTAYFNVMRWGLKPIDESNHKRTNIKNNKSEWIYKESHNYIVPTETASQLVKAKSPDTALQLDWRTPTDFPCCPTTLQNGGLEEYAAKLQVGNVFSSNQYSCHKVIDKALVDDGKALLVVTHDTTEDAVKPYGLAKIYCSGGQFVHESISTFFEENGAMQFFTEMQGLVWEGEESIDMYCM